MKNKLNTFLAAAGAVLGVAGLALILISVFNDSFPLLRGLLCVALGMAFMAVRELDGYFDKAVAHGSWKIFATPFATVLFPAPEGPSIAIEMIFSDMTNSFYSFTDAALPATAPVEYAI